MSTRTLVTTVCDMPHSDDAHGQSVTLTLAELGTFEIDMCGECAEKFLLPVLTNARKPARKGGKRKGQIQPIGTVLRRK